MILLITLLAALPLAAVDWARYAAGPVEVVSSTGEREARQVLASFDQVRHFTGKLLAKPDMTPLWPVRIVLVSKGRESAKYAQNRLTLRRGSYGASLVGDSPVPETMLQDFVRILLRDDTRGLPGAMESGLVRALAAVDVDATRLTFRAPADAQDRTRDWALIYQFAIHEEYTARSRVFFSNLSNGADLDTAARNAFTLRAEALTQQAATFLAAGQFPPIQQIGLPLNPGRDYRPRPVDALRALVHLADVSDESSARKMYADALNRGSKDPDAFDGAGLYAEAIANGSENARAWLAHAGALKDPTAKREA
jgi:hypothetical protein